MAARHGPDAKPAVSWRGQLALAIRARRSDPHPRYSWLNMVLAVLLGILSLFPLATQTFSNLAFWGPFWVGCAVPVVALWSALYQRDLRRAARAGAAANAPAAS